MQTENVLALLFTVLAVVLTLFALLSSNSNDMRPLAYAIICLLFALVLRPTD